MLYHFMIVIESVQDSVAHNVEDLDADQKPGSKFVPRQSPRGLRQLQIRTALWSRPSYS